MVFIFLLGVIGLLIFNEKSAKKFIFIAISGVIVLIWLFVAHGVHELVVDLDEKPDVMLAQFAFGVASSALIVLIPRTGIFNRLA